MVIDISTILVCILIRTIKTRDDSFEGGAHEIISTVLTPIQLQMNAAKKIRYTSFRHFYPHWIELLCVDFGWVATVFHTLMLLLSYNRNVYV